MRWFRKKTPLKGRRQSGTRPLSNAAPGFAGGAAGTVNRKLRQR